MKYLIVFFAILSAWHVDAQDSLKQTPKGAFYQIYKHGAGEKVKEGDIITFEYVQKTDKDSVLYSTYVSGHPGQARIQPSQNIADLMEIFPLLAVNDSLLVKVPTDSLFKGHEEARPPFFSKGSNLDFTIKILRTQTIDQFVDSLKQEEIKAADKYISDHHLNMHTTASGLKYQIIQPSNGRKPVVGDTLLVNYAGKDLNDKVFDSSIESVAKAAGLEQPGRTYEPLQVVAGAGGVIPGWEEGLLLLNEGSKAIMVIPSKLAYGESGYQGIPPFSTLVFDLELVKVKPAKKIPAAPPVPKKPAAKKPVYKKKATPKKN
ncbi:MAG TPA: FKBP-type peptidyl-prolyl cis-trans isomerase [Mucilaginibacter sp.]|nr:FKBP-type peptidyl-prolyl cis-trans isomerase [Mucilaginibacter sp.]